MSTETAHLSPWEDTRVADALDRFLAEETPDHEAVLAMLPSLFGVSDKATYLGYRALGFTPAQALQILELPEDQITYWKNTTPEFLQFEAEQLPVLQSTVSTELIRLGFLKNMAMFVAKDATLIRKSLAQFGELSKREFDYLMAVRKHYTPNDMYNLDKALNPTKHQDNIVINLEWGIHQASEPQQVIPGVQAAYKVIGESDGSRIPLSSPEEPN